MKKVNLFRSTLSAFFRWAFSTSNPEEKEGIRIVARLLLQYRGLVSLVLLGSVAAAAFEGSTMGILAIAVSVLVDDEVLPQLLEKLTVHLPTISSLLGTVDRQHFFLILVCGAVVAQLARATATYCGRCVTIKLQYKLSRELQELATNHVMKFSYGQIGQYAAGELEAKIAKTAEFAGLVGTTNRVVLSLCMFCVYIGVMFVLSVSLALSALLISALLALGLSFLIKYFRDFGQKTIQAILDTGRNTVEFLNAPRLLRVFDATIIAAERINHNRDRALLAIKTAGYLRAFVDPVVDSLTIIAAGVFLVVGYFLSAEDDMSSLPQLLVFLLMLNRMMPQVKALNEARMAFAHTMPTVGMLVSFLQIDDKDFIRTNGDKGSDFQKEIRFEEVSFRYRSGDEYALRDITLTIPRGGTTAIVGRSGSGKTTMMNLLLGLCNPSGGRIMVDKTDLQDINLSSWLSQIGAVDQDVFLLNTTVAENIAFTMETLDYQKVERAAHLAHAHEFVIALPDQYRTKIGDRGFRLSGGQQQRLALARALVRDPQILLLDEATSALDTESELLIQDTLSQLRETHTIVIIAHRLSTITAADQIIVLEDGEIAEIGSPEELLHRDGRFRSFWEQQKLN